MTNSLTVTLCSFPCRYIQCVHYTILSDLCKRYYLYNWSHNNRWQPDPQSCSHTTTMCFGHAHWRVFRWLHPGLFLREVQLSVLILRAVEGQLVQNTDQFPQCNSRWDQGRCYCDNLLHHCRSIPQELCILWKLVEMTSYTRISKSGFRCWYEKEQFSQWSSLFQEVSGRGVIAEPQTHTWDVEMEVGGSMQGTNVQEVVESAMGQPFRARQDTILPASSPSQRPD